MHFLFAAIRFFPYWGFPLALVIGEVGRYFRRRGSKKQWTCFVAAGILILLSLAWIVFRGDLNSDAWVRFVIGRD